MSYTVAELRELLSHPDAWVRSNADWALEARGAGWRKVTTGGIASYRIEDSLRERLNSLARHSLAASNKFYLD